MGEVLRPTPSSREHFKPVGSSVVRAALVPALIFMVNAAACTPARGVEPQIQPTAAAVEMSPTGVATEAVSTAAPTEAPKPTATPEAGTAQQPISKETVGDKVDGIVALLKNLGKFEKYFDDVKGGDVLIGRARVQHVAGGDNPDLKYSGSDQVLRNTPIEKGLLGVAKEALLAGDTKTAETMLSRAELYLTQWNHDKYPPLTPESTPNKKFGRGGKAAGGVISIPEYAEAYFQVVELLGQVQLSAGK